MGFWDAVASAGPYAKQLSHFNSLQRDIHASTSLHFLQATCSYDKIWHDTRCYINVRSKANMSQLNLPHGTDNYNNNNNDRLTAFDPGQPG